MRINEVAKLTGLTVRALHHYDNIGLLSPETEASGYRNYSREDLERLQEIMFFRELDFSLTEIKRIVDAPDFDRAKAMERRWGFSARSLQFPTLLQQKPRALWQDGSSLLPIPTIRVPMKSFQASEKCMFLTKGLQKAWMLTARVRHA